MENPGTARNNKKEGIEVNCIIATARDLMEEIEARDSGSKDNNLGTIIEGNVSTHKCFYDKETKKGYREDEKGIKKEGNPKIMRQAYEAHKKREKEDRGR